MGLFPRRRQALGTVGEAAVLDRVHGLDGRRRRYVARRPGASFAAPEGSRVLAAWTDSADEAAARAFFPPDLDDAGPRAALAALVSPLGCRLAAEEPCAAADPRLAASELELYRAENAPRRRVRRGAKGEAAAPEGYPIYAVRGPAAPRGTDGAGDPSANEGTGASAEVPARLRVEASLDFPAFSLLVPSEFQPAPGAIARAVPTAVLTRSAAAALGARTAIACAIPIGASKVEWTLLFPPLPVSDPGSPAAAERFAALAAASAKAAAAFLASLKLPAGEASVAPPVRSDAPFGAGSSAPFAVEAELRLGARDIPFLAAVHESAARFLSKLAGDEIPDAGTDPAARFLEANRRLRARLAPHAARRFAARPSLAAFLRLLDDSDRARLVSRLAAAFRPAELVKALYAATETRDGSAALAPRAGFRARDLVARAPSIWAEDFEAALASLDPADAPDEAEAAAADLAALGYVAGELGSGRLELSPFARSALAPAAARFRDGRFAEFRAACESDGFEELASKAGRRLGASALAGVPDRTLAIATLGAPVFRDLLKNFMSPGRRRAFSEELVWIDARHAEGGLDPAACLAARAEARERFAARLEALRKGEAAARDGMRRTR
ncbi:MAG: hypothetical protein KBC36_11000 [Spirochaetia bacterium]|nr:hypothetical protein [Spirochaetia bacterium]